MSEHGKLSDRTLGIINDIAEDIDNREARRVLRQTIAELADERMHITEQEHLKRMDAQTEAMMKFSGKLDEIQDVATLRAEVETLRRDKERLDWLEAQKIVKLSFHLFEDKWEVESVQWDEPFMAEKGDIRFAIDAATSTQAGGEGA